MVEFTAGSRRDRHQKMMQGLKQRLSGITAVLPQGRPVVYLDYPVHNNVGDLLIHQGADAFLKVHRYDVVGSFSLHDFSRRVANDERSIELKPSIRDLDALVKRTGCTVVLHGGGNFGDVWPQFQMFRELIVDRYRDTPIVVLPQSIHFSSAEQRRRSADALSRHRQLFIFVRDTESLAFVRDDVGAGCAVMPDMAHQLWGDPEFAPIEPQREAGTLHLRRRDRETRNADTTSDHFDWDELNSAASRFMLRALRKWQTIDNPLRHWVSNDRLWRGYRDHLVQRAVDRFRPYACIDTDRLHGMILGALLGKQVRYGEGNYGKLHRYAALWLAESDMIEGESARQAAE